MFIFMRRGFWIAFIIVSGVAFSVTCCSKKSTVIANTYTTSIDGITVPAQAGKQYLQLYDKQNSPHDVLLKGVNLGIAKPGFFPGEAAITKEEYSRWLKLIGAMNANVIRVYTLHPPAFYEALSEYNAKAEHPLYVLHGIWINEEKMTSAANIYDKELTEEFIQDIKQIIDVVHGNALIAAQSGHASGMYQANISPYVIGWVLGIEWDPIVVKSTNDKNNGKPDFEGQYLKTDNASPFEVWLAGVMDETVSYETAQYSWQRPISFTNWVTTDLISHPSEPSDTEDWVSVDPNVIKAQPAFHAGYFALYHVYPYYPDFLNYETKYTDYVDFRGEKNSYAGYLHDLKQVHPMPVIIGEFGVPSSRGMTHRNVYGWNQGFHSEEEQGNIDARLFEDIHHEGMAGGLVFTWQDEWFKRTWNTQQLDNPDRRPFWSNAQTSEQQFGLLSFDPGNEKSAMDVDGATSDWEQANLSPAPIKAVDPITALDQDDHQRKIERWDVTSDARYVYFRIDFGKGHGPFDWSKVGAMILLDTIPDQGQHHLPGGSGLMTEAGIDFVIDLKGPNKSRIVVDSYYDPFYYEYGEILNLLPKQKYANQKNNGKFHREVLGLNRPLDVPNVHGQTLHLPLDSYETGALQFGDSNPSHSDFNSLTDFAYNEKDHVVEVRIPWQLLHVKDPSTHEIMGDIWKGGLESSLEIPGIKLAVVTYRPDIRSTLDTLGSADISYITTGITNGKIMTKDMFEYRWDNWDVPAYHERLKKSYSIMKRIFKKSDVSTGSG